MKKYQSPILLAILIIVLSTSFFLYRIESEKRILQEELIELSKVKYGLFSVDEWEEILSEIITKRINDFDLDDTNKDKIRERVSSFLETSVDELEDSFNEKNTGSVTGFLKRGTAKVTDVFGVMKEDIPEITESIITFMNDPENRERIKEYLIKKMNEYSEETFSEIDYSKYNQILAKHGASEKQMTIRIIKAKIDFLESQRTPYTTVLFSCIVLLFLGIMFSKELGQVDFTYLTVICGVLLLVGILLPMINIDARVSEMTFHLMGEQIQFTDQVLYFKSKSILEVVSLMLGNSKPDVFLVGFLVLLFSVIFPFSKLVTSLAYLFFEKLRNNKIIKFLVFKTAKWSMADVMVVAIFMAFIGFSGIVSEQLKDLENIALNVDILTTNASSLQIGFFLFTSFAVLSTAVSYKLQYSFKGEESNPTPDPSQK